MLEWYKVRTLHDSLFVIQFTVRSAVPTSSRTPSEYQDMVRSAVHTSSHTPSEYRDRVRSAIPTSSHTPSECQDRVRSAVPTSSRTPSEYQDRVQSTTRLQGRYNIINLLTSIYIILHCWFSCTVVRKIRSTSCKILGN